MWRVCERAGLQPHVSVQKPNFSKPEFLTSFLARMRRTIAWCDRFLTSRLSTAMISSRCCSDLSAVDTQMMCRRSDVNPRETAEPAKKNTKKTGYFSEGEGIDQESHGGFE